MVLSTEVLLKSNLDNFLVIGDDIGWIIEENNVSTGYHWEILPDNSGTYEIIEDIALLPATSLLGVSGYKIWKIKPIKIGTGTILLNKFAPGKTDSPSITDSFSIIVSDKKSNNLEIDNELNATVGGWGSFHDLTSEEKALFEKAMISLKGVDYVPYSVSTQVVAGINYRFKCTATVVYPNAKPYKAIVQIYKPLSGEPVITDIHKF